MDVDKEVNRLESWRKEIYRPIYHLHKWWAQRLGSVFRAVLLGSFAPAGSNILELFYQPARLPGAVVFDPFMGSGTTLGEALKLDARAIGRDINPVAYFAVRNALAVPRARLTPEEILPAATSSAATQIARLNQAGRRLSRNDVRVVLMAQVIGALSRLDRDAVADSYLEEQRPRIEAAIENLFSQQAPAEHRTPVEESQLRLF